MVTITFNELKEIEFDRAHSPYKDLKRVAVTDKGAEGVNVSLLSSNQNVAIVMSSFRLIDEKSAIDWLKNYLKDYGITAYNYVHVNSEELWFNINAYVRVQS